MAIQGVAAVPAGELLASDLRVPPYQRPYSWEPPTAVQLFNDISDALDDEDRSGVSYVIGAVILHQERGDGPLDLVDGQQRLLTLTMLLKVLEGVDGSLYTSVPDSPVALVWNALSQRVEPCSADERSRIRSFVTERCQFVRVVTDDADEAFRIFDSQNYRGKSLDPHDLLKAHHLREMRGESDAMMAAVVETWESVSDKDLDRLFSTFLYRIARWTRGESAPAFTTRDIGMFKGIAAAEITSPSARYHLAAQAAVPLLSAWASSTQGAGAHDLGRTRFQLDAPVPAGRGFFEMVSFMLEELAALRRAAFDGWEQFGSYIPGAPGADREVFTETPSRSRYRYVSELYLAALLYYTNKFGDDGIEAARRRLFAWAFTPRAGMLRVQFRSVDRLAQGLDGTSAFVALRNATSGRAVHELPSSSMQYNNRPEHEADLSAVLKGLGAR